MREIGKQTQLLFLCFVTILASVVAVFHFNPASAAQITNRKLTLQAGSGGDGGSLPGGRVNHLFNFTLPGNSTVGSIKFEYCTTASVTACVTPQGLDTNNTSPATALGDETGSGVTGWTINTTTDGAPYIYKTPGAIGSSPVNMNIRLDNIINPNVQTPTPLPNYTFFVRISTYASNDTTGSPIDTGTVNASTAEAIQLTGVMPESLIFCTGETVSTNCSTTTDGTISFNQLFSPTDTATATSQMSASTNAGGGYAITVNGTTLTSGSNTIPAMSTAGVGVPGTGQFGLNLRANTTSTADSFPGTSADLAPASNGTDLKGQATSDYNTIDTFRFVSGAAVANSAYDGASNNTLGPTNSQVYTVSYIVNVAGNQLAGTYTSTLTYICTPTF